MQPESLELASHHQKLKHVNPETNLTLGVEPEPNDQWSEHRGSSSHRVGDYTDEEHTKVGRGSTTTTTRKHIRTAAASDDETGTRSVDGVILTLKRSRHSRHHQSAASDVLGHGISSIGMSRFRRSIENNEIDMTEQDSSTSWQRSDSNDDDEDDVITTEYNVPSKTTRGRRILPLNINRQRYHYRNYQQTNNHKLTTATKAKPSSADLVDEQFTEPPAARNTNGRRKSRQRHLRKRPATATNDDSTTDHHSQMLPDPSEYYDSGGTTFWKDEVDDGLCKRRHLMVDFTDIGWQDWILSPSSFEAFYCDGECRFPISKVWIDSEFTDQRNINTIL